MYYQEPYQNQDQQSEVHPISRSYGQARGVARLGLFVSGALAAALTSRIFAELQPIYAIAAGTALCLWLGRLALLRDPDVRSRDLLIGSVVIAGSLLGWWDWVAEQFAVLGGEKIWVQLAIVLGVTGLVVALHQSLTASDRHRQDDYNGGYTNDYYQ